MSNSDSANCSESIAHPACEELQLGAVLHALSDPVRLQIVAELAQGEGECTCGSFELPVTKSTCTHHFKVLREAGVIRQRQQGTTRLNALRRIDLETRFPGLLETILRAADELPVRSAASGAAAAAREHVIAYAERTSAPSASGGASGPATAAA